MKTNKNIQNFIGCDKEYEEADIVLLVLLTMALPPIDQEQDLQLKP